MSLIGNETISPTTEAHVVSHPVTSNGRVQSKHSRNVLIPSQCENSLKLTGLGKNCLQHHGETSLVRIQTTSFTKLFRQNLLILCCFLFALSNRYSLTLKTTMANSYVPIPQDYDGIAPALAIRTLPYSQTPKGMGMMLCTMDLHQVMSNPTGDRSRFNEPENLYGRVILSLSFIKAHERQDQGRAARSKGEKGETKEERIFVGLVFAAEAKRLALLADMNVEHFNTKHRQYAHAIMRGFNTDPHETGNTRLENLTDVYFRIRLGYEPYDLDEYTAAMKAVQVDYTSKPFATMSDGQGPWTLPIVHLLNGHLVFRKMAPIAFRPRYTDDEAHAKHAREKNSRTVWINGERAQIERRSDVREQMFQFLKARDAELKDPPAYATEAPEETPQVQETPRRVPKVNINLPKSGKKRRRKSA